MKLTVCCTIHLNISCHFSRQDFEIRGICSHAGSFILAPGKQRASVGSLQLMRGCFHGRGEIPTTEPSPICCIHDRRPTDRPRPSNRRTAGNGTFQGVSSWSSGLHTSHMAEEARTTRANNLNYIWKLTVGDDPHLKQTRTTLSEEYDVGSARETSLVS